jgi:hypothetical protein
MPVPNDLRVDKKEGKTYPPLPKDIYQVELLDVGSQDRPTYATRNKPEAEREIETVLTFQFTLLDGKDGETNLRGRNVWANFIPTYLYIGKNGKNKLYRIIEALLKREIKPEEEAIGVTGEQLNKLIGHQCRISVEPKVSGEKSFDNITDWYKSNTELNSLTVEEKEEARVKVNDEKKSEEEVDLTDIPF